MLYFNAPKDMESYSHSYYCVSSSLALGWVCKYCVRVHLCKKEAPDTGTGTDINRASCARRIYWGGSVCRRDTGTGTGTDIDKALRARRIYWGGSVCSRLVRFNRASSVEGLPPCWVGV